MGDGGRLLIFGARVGTIALAEEGFGVGAGDAVDVVEDGDADEAAELRIVADEGGKELLVEVCEGGSGITEAGELFVANGDGEGFDGKDEGAYCSMSF